jgi:16S rRNA (uracil1498-N3)-methyltransferase
MRMLRFFVGDTELKKRILVEDRAILHQWLRVLRLKLDDKVVLFNFLEKEATYRLGRIKPSQVEVIKVEDLQPRRPRNNITLAWSVLKKDKNELVVQKATELGVKKFMAILSSRSVKTGLNLDRLEKVAIEAAEQSGRSDIPRIENPIGLDVALLTIPETAQILVAQKNDTTSEGLDSVVFSSDEEIFVFIGPEGGWSAEEIRLLKAQPNSSLIDIADFTLRAETAAVTSIGLLQWWLREGSNKKKEEK